jgi:hypothetical protein
MTQPYSQKYADTLTLAEARTLFFARSGLGEDGGYNARWVRIEMNHSRFIFPTPPAASDRRNFTTSTISRWSTKLIGLVRLK